MWRSIKPAYCYSSWISALGIRYLVLPSLLPSIFLLLSCPTYVLYIFYIIFYNMHIVMCQRQMYRWRAFVIISWKPQINAAKKIITGLFQRRGNAHTHTHTHTHTHNVHLITHTTNMVARMPVGRFFFFFFSQHRKALNLIRGEFLQ